MLKPWSPSISECDTFGHRALKEGIEAKWGQQGGRASVWQASLQGGGEDTDTHTGKTVWQHGGTEEGHPQTEGRGLRRNQTHGHPGLQLPGLRQNSFCSISARSTGPLRAASRTAEPAWASGLLNYAAESKMTGLSLENTSRRTQGLWELLCKTCSQTAQRNTAAVGEAGRRRSSRIGPTRVAFPYRGAWGGSKGIFALFLQLCFLSEVLSKQTV